METSARAHASRVISITLAIALAVASLLMPASANGRESNHFVTPAGDDLNVVFETDDAFIAPFCTEAKAGDQWRAVVRWAAAGNDGVFPNGYTPSRTSLDEDFLAKFVSARYVVDAGTPRERQYVVPAGEHLIQQGTLPDGSVFVRWATGSLRPLTPGDHTVDEYVTLTADSWDGFGVDPAVNLIPAGESFVGSVTFEVLKPDAS